MDTINPPTDNASALSNLLPNPAFQLSKPGNHGSPTGWTWEGPAELATVVEDKPLQGFGNSLNLDFRNIEPGRIAWYCWSDYVAIDSRQSYLQSGWIKTGGDEKGYGASFARRFYDADKNLIPTAENQNYVARNVAPVTWERFSQVIVPQRKSSQTAYGEDEIPANARYVRIGAFSTYYPRQVWFNDVRLEAYSPAITPFSYGDNKFAAASDVNGQQIKIDGQSGEAVWNSGAEWQSGFTRTVCPESEISVLPQNLQTKFKTALDQNNFYLMIRCNAPDPAALKSTTKAHNDMAVFAGDNAEVFLDASGKRRASFHLAVNPAGAFYEEWSNGAANLGLQVATKKNDDGWQAEISIPRQMLWQLYHEAGSDMDAEMWNINITRTSPEAGANKYSSWAYTGPSGFANEGSSGFLLIGKPKSILLKELSETEKQLRQYKALPAKTETNFVPAELARLHSAAEEIERYNAGALDKVRNAGEISSQDFVRYLLTARQSTTAYKNIFDRMQRLMVEIPPSRAKFGYVLFRPPLFERPNNERIPAQDELCSQLKLQMAANEYGQVNFSVFTKADLKDVQIIWSDMKGAQGRSIAQKDIDLRVVEPWGSRRQADILATDLRIPLQGWLSGYADQKRIIPLIAHDTSRKIWIRINPEKPLTPGVYKGEIKVQPANKPSTVLPFEVTVLPFELPATTRMSGFYYHGVLKSENQPPLGSKSYMFYNGLTTPESCLRELKAIRRAGFTMVALVDYANGPLDPAYSRKLLSLAKQAGFETVALIGSEHIITQEVVRNPQKTAEARALLKARVQQIYKSANELGIKTLYIYGSDEPHQPEDFERNKIISEVAREAGGQMAVAMIFSNSYAAVAKDAQLPIMSWASMTGDADATQRYISDNNAGKKILYYANLAADATALERLTFGLYLYKSGLGGNIPWAYYYLGLNWEPFTEEYPIDTAYFCIPTKDDPIPTLKFEAAVAGVTDLRYCELLEKLIASCPNKTVAAQARKEFDQILQKVELLNKQGINSANYTLPPEILEASRARLQHLIALVSKNRL